MRNAVRSANAVSVRSGRAVEGLIASEGAGSANGNVVHRRLEAAVAELQKSHPVK